jgi:hypothetical protein
LKPHSDVVNIDPAVLVLVGTMIGTAARQIVILGT